MPESDEVSDLVGNSFSNWKDMEASFPEKCVSPCVHMPAFLIHLLIDSILMKK